MILQKAVNIVINVRKGHKVDFFSENSFSLGFSNGNKKRIQDNTGEKILARGWNIFPRNFIQNT